MRSRPDGASQALTLTAVVAATLAVHAQDWPQWRGPDRDGVIAAFTPPAAWPGRLTRRWQVEVGTGYATPLVVGERVFTFTRQGDEEVLRAMDAATGRRLWRAAYPAVFAMNPATRQHGPGPKSTPTFADGRIFTLGMTGVVFAFDAREGHVLWQAPAPPVQPQYHTAMSPVAEGNLVIVHVGGQDNGALTAFDVASGRIAWRWTGDGPACGSPMVATLGGTRQVITFTQRNFVGVSLADGALLWRRPYTTPATTTAQTPVVHEDLVIESGRANGITAFRPTRAGRTIFSLEDDGELVVMRASRTGFEPVAQYEVATSATWAQPAISGRRIFVKDASSLTLWTVD